MLRLPRAVARRSRATSATLAEESAIFGGPLSNILALWNKFFPAHPGHWGGWAFLTYPVITEVEFTDAQRTKVAARVTVGYSGATVLLEKEAGKWVAKSLTNRWIT